MSTYIYKFGMNFKYIINKILNFAEQINKDLVTSCNDQIILIEYLSLWQFLCILVAVSELATVPRFQFCGCCFRNCDSVQVFSFMMAVSERGTIFLLSGWCFWDCDSSKVFCFVVVLSKPVTISMFSVFAVALLEFEFLG